MLDDEDVAALSASNDEPVALPPHLELRFELHAASAESLDRGQFRLWAPSVSRGIGALLGRAAGLLDQRYTELMASIPAADTATVPVQISFSPLDPGDAHVARAPRLLGEVVGVAEHHHDRAGVLAVDDLAVGCDRRRLFLASLSTGRRLEPLVMHALDLRGHAPPLARFLAEIGQAGSASVAGFDWGAAWHLPFLPRVTYGRTVLAPAQWRLDAADIGADPAEQAAWLKGFAAWRAQRLVPRHVRLAEGDRLLPLDLEQPAHADLVAANLTASGQAVLVEGTRPEAFAWQQGRAHELVVPLIRTGGPPPPRREPARCARVQERDDGHMPGVSPWLHAKLYGHPDRQPEIIGRHLSQLLAAWHQPPMWWFTRYRDPEPHLRLRIALDDANEFGTTAERVARWATELRRAGLLGEVVLAPSYQEAGRWGAGAAMAAAEAVFAADSVCVAGQFAQRRTPPRQALTAANFMAIACGFTGSIDAGAAWLIGHGRPARTGPALDRSLLAEAVRLAEPADDWAALRSAPGGPEITASWAARERALAGYRTIVDQSAGDLDADLVTDSLLHLHHIRATGIAKHDEHLCLRLARAAAHAWAARHPGTVPS